MNNKKIVILVRTALFLALAFVVTYFVSFPLAIGNINLGDSVILVGAMFLPTLPLAFASGCGPMFADLAAGYGSYAPYTLVIKFIEGLIVGIVFKKMKVIKNEYVRFLIATLLAVIIIPLGYFIANTIMYGYGAAVGTVVNDILQAGASVVIANVLFFALKKAKLDDKA